MFKSGLISALILGAIATQANAQPAETAKALDWQARSHHSMLSKKELIADKRIKVQDRLAILDFEAGAVYLYCKESGALLDAVPTKDAYSVLIFPEPSATKFNFKKITPHDLQNEGIDVELLQKVLKMNRGRGMSGPSTPFTLDIRITAKVNRDKDSITASPP
ncbi:MAG: hypothetical protein IT423_10800 [Pirellulaceae bacterium]|nr:hypothetical protein [Pirellulaceae bacterium]